MPELSGSLQEINAQRDLIDREIWSISRSLSGAIKPQLREAVQYAMEGSGKRFRGILVIYSYEAAGGTGNVLPLAAAVEIIHAYSLVHDDLPCMDDDSFRRGRPTTHVVHGVEIATLAGLTMLPVAIKAFFDTAGNALNLRPAEATIIVQGLLQAAGSQGMIGGQLRDLRAEGKEVSLDILEEIHKSKTGALITASARLGGVAARGSKVKVAALEQYGADLGLAFQIVDDILDVTSTTDQLGKTAGKDVMLSKCTYPALLGVQGAVDRATALVERGCTALKDADLFTPALQQIANLVITRKN